MKAKGHRIEWPKLRSCKREIPSMETEVELRRIKLPNTRAYDRAGTGDHSLFSDKHCCVCGKSVSDPQNWLLLSRAEDGTFEFAILHPTDASAAEREASLWVAPIGSDCLRKNSALKPFVISRAATIPSPTPVGDLISRAIALRIVDDVEADAFNKTGLVAGNIAFENGRIKAAQAIALELKRLAASPDAAEICAEMARE